MTDTDPRLAEIPALHAVAKSGGQKTISGRTLTGALVVLVHVIFLLIFWISPPAPEIDPGVSPAVTYLDLAPLRRNSNSVITPDREIIPRGQATATDTAPILIPPPRVRTQEETDAEILGGLGRALACTAGQYEYLAPSLRNNCRVGLVPWSLNRQAMEMGRFRATDPNLVPLPPLSQIENARRVGETSDGCVPGASGPANDACRALHPKGVPVAPSGFGVQW